MSAFTKSIEALTGMTFDASTVERIDEFASCNLFARKQLRDEYLRLAVAAITPTPNVKGQPWIDPRKAHEADALIESRALAIFPSYGLWLCAQICEMSKSARARSPHREKATADSSKRRRRKPARGVARKAVRS